jgi:hypothetical protein
VRRLALILALSTGCFYVDPINQRPSIAIDMASSNPVFRGDVVMLTAEIDDPEGDEELTQVQWHAYLCTDATDQGTCDMAAAFYSADTHDASFQVPARRADGVTPVQSVLVTLDATDPGGARAKPEQQLIIPVNNRAPDIPRLYADPPGAHVLGTKIKIFAAYGDFDDGPEHVTLTEPWTVGTPDVMATFTLAVVSNPQQDPNDPAHVYVARTLTTGSDPVHDVGQWTVMLTATDPIGAQTQQTLMLNITPDEPPCIATVAPIVPPAGVSLPVFEPTLFEVPVVTDDLDVYPPRQGDDLGVATFAWTVKPPGSATRRPFGTGSSVDFDPSAFQPGDLVEIRVEVTDRAGRTVNCPDSDDTCSISPDPSCIQRQTWHVEVQ